LPGAPAHCELLEHGCEDVLNKFWGGYAFDNDWCNVYASAGPNAATFATHSSPPKRASDSVRTEPGCSIPAHLSGMCSSDRAERSGRGSTNSEKRGDSTTQGELITTASQARLPATHSQTCTQLRPNQPVRRLGRLLRSLLVGALEDVDRAVLEENLGRVLPRLELLVRDRVGGLDSDKRAAREHERVS